MVDGLAAQGRRTMVVMLVALGLGVVAAPASAQTTKPVIQGTPQVNEVLTASLAGATPEATFAWLRCDKEGQACVRTGATGSTYTIAPEDEAWRLRVRSTDAGVTSTSAATAVIGLVRVIERPSIEAGDFTLRGAEGRYDPQYSVREVRSQWLRCNINGFSCVETEHRYCDVPSYGPCHQLGDEDFATRFKLRVRVTNRAGTLIVDSLPTGPIGKPRPSAYTYQPKVTGVATPGQTLTAHQGMWYPGADKIDSFSYAWRRCNAAGWHCDTLVGSDTTYVPTTEDLGLRLRVHITATNAAGTTRWISPPTRAVGAPVLTRTPVITGPARVGETLTAGTGSWNPAAESYTYEWRRCYDTYKCYPVGTGATYQITENDTYGQFSVRVTATNAYGSTTVASRPTERVPSEG